MPKGYTFDSSHGPGVGMSSSGSRSSGSGGSSYSSGSSGSGSSITQKIITAAQNISNAVSSNTGLLGQKVREYMDRPVTSAQSANMYDSYLTDYGNGFDMDEYFEKLMDLAQMNNDWSAGQAEKQMQYQTRSDQAAMAWSAQEAARSRAWTENLSNTAHQREIKDLISAGLNPILSANQGAWAGSGAVGQSHSSSGAMGTVDTGATTAIGALMSNQIASARDMAISKMQVDQQRYATDQQFAMAKLAAETSIYNNNSNIDANKAINAMNRDADIQKAGISANATRAAAAMSAGAVTSAAAQSAAAARYSAQMSHDASIHKTNADYDLGLQQQLLDKYKHDNPSGSTKYQSNHNIWSDPVYYGGEAGQYFVDKGVQILDSLNELGERYSPFKTEQKREGRGF